jgi:hypothetical protein
MDRLLYILVTSKSFPSYSFFKGFKKVKTIWHHIWTESWIFRDFPLQFPEGFQRVGAGIVVQLQDTL